MNQNRRYLSACIRIPDPRGCSGVQELRGDWSDILTLLRGVVAPGRRPSHPGRLLCAATCINDRLCPVTHPNVPSDDPRTARTGAGILASGYGYRWLDRDEYQPSDAPDPHPWLLCAEQAIHIGHMGSTATDPRHVFFSRCFDRRMAHSDRQAMVARTCLPTGPLPRYPYTYLVTWREPRKPAVHTLRLSGDALYEWLYETEKDSVLPIQLRLLPQEG